MAFVSMFIVFIVIAAVIFGLMLITGLILLIVGIVNKSRPKHSGKKFPMVCIVSGSVLLALPLMAAAVVMFWGIAGVVKEAFQSREYDSLSERWSSQLLLTDSDDLEGIRKAILRFKAGGMESKGSAYYRSRFSITANSRRYADIIIG